MVRLFHVIPDINYKFGLLYPASIYDGESIQRKNLPEYQLREVKLSTRIFCLRRSGSTDVKVFSI